MAVKERDTNVVCNDTVTLRLYQFNENTASDVQSINKVEIYFLDPYGITCENPDGRKLIQTTAATRNATGEYSVAVTLTSPLYGIGKYIDVWYIIYKSGECPGTTKFGFSIGADKWYANSQPYIWSFDFAFRPTRFRKNEKKHIIVEVTPNVPHISDLERYYADLNTYPALYVSLSLRCAECVPVEQDLRTVVERQKIEVRNKRLGYFFLDTTDLDCGIYDIWFDLDMGESTFISPKNQIQIHD